MFSSPSSNRNRKTTTLDAAAERENLNCILKFELPVSVAQHIDLRLIFYDIYIDNYTIASDIQLNS